VQSVTGLEQERMTGEAYTFDGDFAIVKGGKKQPLTVTFNIVYTAEATEAYELARGEFETTGCGGTCCVKYYPAGGGIGTQEKLITGILKRFAYPPADASAGGPVMASFDIYASSVITSTVVS